MNANLPSLIRWKYMEPCLDSALRDMELKPFRCWVGLLGRTERRSASKRALMLMVKQPRALECGLERYYVPTLI